MQMSGSGKGQTSSEVACSLCKLPYREPFSGPCKHAACKCCWAVHFTRDCAGAKDVPCPSCNTRLKLQEVRPDQAAQRRLQKYKNTRCKNCDWKGSYSDYIMNHERVCGGIIRIQCKVLGCGKWLPKDKALDLHRADDWCPMILLMKKRLSHAEIVHLSMRESWNWTCGLVLRSDKPSVRDCIDMLVLVFSHLDPDTPTSLNHDEYIATTHIGEGSVDSNITSSHHLSTGASNHCKNESAASSSTSKENSYGHGGESQTDLHSPVRLQIENNTSQAACNLPYDESLLQFDETEQERLQYSQGKGKLVAAVDRELKQVTHRVHKMEKDFTKTTRDIDKQRQLLEDMINMPRAFAALSEKLAVHEGILATFNNEVIVMNTKMDNFQVPSMLADTGILEKLVKANQDINRSITSLAQSMQKLDTRLLEIEMSHSGVLLWKISNYSQKKREAATTNIKSLYSQPFFTSQFGYKLCGRIFLVGDGVGKGTHISLFLTIMKGPYDAVVPWPFKEKITFQLVNQDDPCNKSIVEAFRPDPVSSSFKRPTSERNIGAGCPLFAKIQMVEDPKQGFVRNDTLFLKIISQTSDLPEIK